MKELSETTLVGDIVDAVVTSVMPFGVFVSWGKSCTGLIHISELSAEYVKDINTFVKKGDNVKAKVVAIDEKGKISLSLKDTCPPPGAQRSEKKKVEKVSARPDSFDWTARRDDSLSFEDKLSKFKHESEEKIRDSKRRIESKRSGGYSRRG